ncbi:hypothetical protein PSHT_01541 [Puccinia striiformis]|uniref:Uncharacterized protein n=1 Tax=Puccinia striiformis TaxID=27350 RepID=A0A2S4WKD6_9BASI|nr:hypothetical protein PSHT_01541 [Puccinia striiformis]
MSSASNSGLLIISHRSLVIAFLLSFVRAWPLPPMTHPESQFPDGFSSMRGLGSSSRADFQAPSSSPQSGRFGFMISIVGDEPHESKVDIAAPVDTLRRFKAEKASDGGVKRWTAPREALSRCKKRMKVSFKIQLTPINWIKVFKSAGRGALSEEEQPTPSSLPEKLISKLWSKIADNLKQLIAPEEGISQKNTLTPADDLKGKLESGNEPGVEAPISSQETNVPVEASASTDDLHQILKGPNLGPSILLKSTSGSLGHKPTLSEDAKRARKHWRSAANKVHAVQSLKGVDKTIHQVDNYLQKIDGVLDVLDFTFKT